MKRKLIIMATCVMVVLSFACAFASGGTSSSGMSGFVGELTTGLDADAIWGAITPIAALMIVAVLVGITRRLINKNLNSLTKGKSGKAN